MIIKIFQPNHRENLYDAERDSHLAGVLYFQMTKMAAEKHVHEENERIVQQLVVQESVRSNLSPIEDDQKVAFFDRFTNFALKVDAIVFPLLVICYKFLRLTLLLFESWLEVWITKLADIFITAGSLLASFSFNRAKKVITYYGVKKNEKNGNNLVKSINLSIKLEKIFNSHLFLFNSYSSLQDHIGIRLKKLRYPLALGFLLLSFTSIAVLLAPLFIAEVSHILMPYSTQNTHLRPTPTPLVYNSYYKPEENPIYPIQEFRIVVPKINLESNIVDNVDPNIEGEYKDKLQFGVAHAKGSYLPPESGGPVYLFAHSTDTVYNIARFNAKFYSVRELVEGDEIAVYFNHKKYSYRVRFKEIINPTEIDRVRQTDTNLILQTCWPPGTDWQRLVVYADLESSLQAGI